MANQLPMEKKIAAVASLCEGSSIRSVERMTGIHREALGLLLRPRVAQAGRGPEPPNHRRPRRSGDTATSKSVLIGRRKLARLGGLRTASFPS
jgi:hypothetical protein